MKIKEEKGISGIDITVAVLLITIFISLITTLFFNIQNNERKIERKAKATYFAVDTIEKIKSDGIQGLENWESKNNTYLTEEEGEATKETPYYFTIEVQDYQQIAEKNNQTGIVAGKVKKVTIKISYQEGAQTQEVSLAAILK